MSGPEVVPVCTDTPDLFAVATMLHALANTYGTCHSAPITVAQPHQPTTLLELLEQP